MRLLAILLDSAFKITLLLLAAHLIAMILRRRSAAERHLVWLAALAGALVLPLIGRLMPVWEPPVLSPVTAFIAAVSPSAPEAASATVQAVEAGHGRLVSGATIVLTVWLGGIFLGALFLLAASLRLA